MHRFKQLTLFSAACSVAFACGGLEEEPEISESESALVAPYITPPAGFGRYCSKTFSDGTHDLMWGDHNSDPCNLRLGGTIRHAGLWDMSGQNRVFVRCTNGGVTIDAPVSGSGNLSTAENSVGSTGSCQFLVAPVALPIFRFPWLTDNNPYMVAGSGVDFAFDTNPSDASAFAYSWPDISCPGVLQLGSTVHLDEERHKVLSAIQDHSGYDWGKYVAGVRQDDWGVRSVAGGDVILARQRFVCSDNQNEVYIEHRVGWSGTPYYERFISYYAHMDDLRVSTGDVVVSGELLGNAGTTGCVNPKTATHLHMSIYRVRNVAGDLNDMPNFVDDHTHADERRMVDPFGWNSGCASDPWARFAPAGEGAPSSNLWRSGFVPPGWDHSGH